MILPAALRAALLLPCLAGPAGARILSVGDGQAFPTPSAAAAAAEDGDTISIAPGTYFDCFVTARLHLVIEGQADGVVLTDRTCQDKAILVLAGDADTVRNLTLQRARVADGNGAGIRLEAPNLRVERVAFINDQVGLLASVPGGDIQIEHSAFQGGGVGGDRPLHAIMVPASATLRIADTVFERLAGGQIATAAARTELDHDRFEADEGAAAVITVAAGALSLQDSLLTIGPAAPPRAAVVLLLDDATATLRRNRLVNRTGAGLTLLLDWSAGDPVLEANILAPGDTVSSTDGLWRHRVGSNLHAMKDGLHAIAGSLKRLVLSHL